MHKISPSFLNFKFKFFGILLGFLLLFFAPFSRQLDFQAVGAASMGRSGNIENENKS